MRRKSIMLRRLSCLAGVFLFVACGSPTSPETHVIRIEGKVTTGASTPVPDALVFLTQEGSFSLHMTDTDASGSYSLQISFGGRRCELTVSVSATGFESARRESESCQAVQVFDFSLAPVPG
jgi:carboxypeptidase family protein